MSQIYSVFGATLVLLGLMYAPLGTTAEREIQLSVDRVTIDTGDFAKEGIGYKTAHRRALFCDSPKVTMSRSASPTLSVQIPRFTGTVSSCHFNKTVCPPSALTA